MKALAAFLSLFPAVASANCGIGSDFERQLAERYSEAKIFEGFAPNENGGGQLMTIWHNPETGTWSVILTQPTGIACVIGAGTFGNIITPEPEDGDPT